MDLKKVDKKGLIQEAYRIEGINDGECRSIFLDWALSTEEGVVMDELLDALLAHYKSDHPDHPMTHVLIEGKTHAASPRRRGGWKSRPRD